MMNLVAPNTELRRQLHEIANVRAALAKSPEKQLAIFKQAVMDGHALLKSDYQIRGSAYETVCGRSLLLDEIIQQAAEHNFGDYLEHMAIIAVGGYGRGELHPSSDIDIMILLKAEHDQQYDNAIERFVMLLWDIKLEVGHSVRSLDECINEATNDITVMTNIMESRLLIGDRSLYKQMVEATSPDKIWNSRAFFESKLEEQHARHIKFEHSAYKLEPNIKESYGGLRDIQMIAWVAKRHFNSKTLEELVVHGFLSTDEYDALVNGEDLLWKIRCSLHYLTGRREDRLLFDYQRDLALEFGYEDGPNNLAIEQFMQRYYRTVMELERLNEMLLQLFKEAILYADQPVEPEIINARFQKVHGFIEVRHSDVFQQTPTALLEVFLILEMNRELLGVRAETIRLIRQHLHLIDDQFRQSDEAKNLFMTIISQPEGVIHELRRMNRYGVLAAYIPVFQKIVGRMQYDLFHAYTVDEHTLTVVRNLRRFSAAEFLHEYPLCSAVFNHLPRPELLYLAGLFHDIAKGRGGDHSELGAVDAMQFCLDHHIDDQDAKLVAWLVKNHLVMSTTAQRRDISDPDVINEFASRVEDQARLDYLYLLTVADIRGTNPTTWNSWKDSLLSELYNKTSVVLRLGKQTTASIDKRIRQLQQSILNLLGESGYLPEQVDRIWHQFNTDYFLRFNTDEVARHIRMILEYADTPLPMIHVDKLVDRGTIEIVVYIQHDDRLFTLTASSLEQQGLNIVDAYIMTTRDNYSLFVFQVLDEEIGTAQTAYRMEEIRKALHFALQEQEPFATAISQRMPRTLKHFTVDTEIQFEQDATRQRTIAQVIATDRPGLLARISQAFNNCGIRVHHAKIATLGERAEDLFYITDLDNHPITEAEDKGKIATAIKESLG